MKKQCIECHFIKRHKAKGRCARCYIAWRRRKNPELVLKNRERVRKAGRKKPYTPTPEQQAEYNKRKRWRAKLLRGGQWDGIKMRWRGKMISTPFKEISKDYETFVKILEKI